MSLQWSDRLALGHPTIDAQHRRLVSLVHELECVAHDGVAVEQQHQVIEALNHYIDEHFRFEEELLRSTDFPGLREHIVAHGKFEGLVRGYQRDLEQGRPFQGLQLLDFLNMWLKAHILGVDRSYIEHLRAAGKMPG